MSYQTTAIVFEQPGCLALTKLGLVVPGHEDCVVDVEWSGISTGTERLLWQGRMPAFPGMGYPLVPGYEAVGRIVDAGAATDMLPGQRVFVPGSRGFDGVRGLFGGAAARVVVSANRLVPLDEDLAEQGVLLALAATAHHALSVSGSLVLPELIVGHGVLGRLMARLVCALGDKVPTVWEVNASRRGDDFGYPVIDPSDDTRNDYPVICDVSGSDDIVNTLMPRLSRGGSIILAGFYEQPVSFNFPPAFMREACLQIAAEWHPDDLHEVMSLLKTKRLSLDGLITHRESPARASAAYHTAFDDADCLKMILDWRTSQ